MKFRNGDRLGSVVLHQFQGFKHVFIETAYHRVINLNKTTYAFITGDRVDVGHTECSSVWLRSVNLMDTWRVCYRSLKHLSVMSTNNATRSNHSFVYD